MSTRPIFYKKFGGFTKTSFSNEADIKFPFTPTRLIIVNDDNKRAVEFSFSRPDLDGELLPEDGPIIFDHINIDRLWLRLDASGSINIRIWAWRGAG